jgi:hypothetical protein
MNATFQQISASLGSRLKTNPSLVEEIIAFGGAAGPQATDAEAVLAFLPADMRKAVEQMPEKMRADFIAQSNRTLAAEAAKSQRVRDELEAAKKLNAPRSIHASDIAEELNIGKAWHGIHFMLCDSSTTGERPLADAVLGGVEIGADRGHGPARYLEPDKVRVIANALARVGLDAFERRYDAVALEAGEVYPGGWVDEIESKRWLCDAYSQLRSFYVRAAERALGVLLYLS